MCRTPGWDSVWLTLETRDAGVLKRLCVEAYPLDEVSFACPPFQEAVVMPILYLSDRQIRMYRGRDFRFARIGSILESRVRQTKTARGS